MNCPCLCDFTLHWNILQHFCRFFSPTISYITSRGHNLHILCLSIGNTLSSIQTAKNKNCSILSDLDNKKQNLSVKIKNKKNTQHLIFQVNEICKEIKKSLQIVVTSSLVFNWKHTLIQQYSNAFIKTKKKKQKPKNKKR